MATVHPGPDDSVADVAATLLGIAADPAQVVFLPEDAAFRVPDDLADRYIEHRAGQRAKVSDQADAGTPEGDDDAPEGDDAPAGDAPKGDDAPPARRRAHRRTRTTPKEQ